jgi:hypothetical protein
MTTTTPTRQELRKILRSLPGWLSDKHHEDDLAEGALQLDRFAQQLTDRALAYREMAAWCRLAAGLARREDVPESIHPQADEDPADTARWQKWRLS